jgi:hypothetical protein
MCGCLSHFDIIVVISRSDTTVMYNNEFHSLYSSPNIVRVIKSRRMRWAGNVARMGEGRGVYRF